MTETSISDSDREDDLETAVEDVDAVVDDAAEHVDEIDETADAEDTGGHGSSFASTALKLLIIVIVVFGLAIWLLPRFAGDMPAGTTAVGHPV